MLGLIVVTLYPLFDSGSIAKTEKVAFRKQGLELVAIRVFKGY